MKKRRAIKKRPRSRTKIKKKVKRKPVKRKKKRRVTRKRRVIKKKRVTKKRSRPRHKQQKKSRRTKKRRVVKRRPRPRPKSKKKRHRKSLKRLKKRRSIKKRPRPKAKKRIKRNKKKLIKKRRPRSRKKIKKKIRRTWIAWPNEKLLGLRISDLHLSIARTELAVRIRQLNSELSRKDFVFRPHFWLSDEWYCPDGVPGVAIPFYLAHPRLKRLERDFMLEVEGSSKESCLRLMRHETGHALLNAYQLHRRRDWRKHFGKTGIPYPDTYLPKPYSKSYVTHLPNWYAQSHPHEDWAETFAVWLKPNSDWRRRYKGWPALKKIEFVDRLMREIRDKRPRLRNRREILPARSLRMTLREFYADKEKRYAADSPEFFNRDLRRLFSDADEHKKNEKASHYIRRVRLEIIDVVGRWTSEYNYRINEVLSEMIERCDDLNLRVVRNDRKMKIEMVACLTMLVMNKLHSGGFHISL
jgi:hypothetical protein